MSTTNKEQQQQIFQKPDTIDTPIYEKPHAYDEEPPVVITASRHGSKSSKMTVDSFASRYFQKREVVHSSASSFMTTSTTATTKDTGTYYSPNTPIESPPLSPKSPLSPKNKLMYNSQITSFLLSQSTPTTQTSFGHHHEKEAQKEKEATPLSYYVLPSSPANSIIEQDDDETLKKESTTTNNTTNIAAAAAALLSNNDSEIVSSFFLKQQQRQITPQNVTSNSSKDNNNNTITYSIRKASLLKPNQHYIYLHIDHPNSEEGEHEDEDIMIYRKIQPTSWWSNGYQSMLYCNKNDGQGVKVAEARTRQRGLFSGGAKEEILIESADYNHSEIPDITISHIPNIKNIPATKNIHCQDLVKISQSNILFEYEIWFNGSRMRWKRPSLLSHDFTCEIKLTRQETKLYYQQLQKAKKKGSLNSKQGKKNKKNKSHPTQQEMQQETLFIDSDSDNDQDDHDNHTHKSCRRWKLIAEFDAGGKNMNYLNKEFGKLSIDLDVLNQVEKERCDLLEAHIVMTCCTLIDLMRDSLSTK